MDPINMTLNKIYQILLYLYMGLILLFWVGMIMGYVCKFRLCEIDNGIKPKNMYNVSSRWREIGTRGEREREREWDRERGERGRGREREKERILKATLKACSDICRSPLQKKSCCVITELIYVI